MGLLKFNGKMGCGPSRASNLSQELKLPGSNVSFNHGQLLALNGYFSDIVDNSDYFSKDPVQEKNLVLIERLIQRLICGVGKIDRRFASKFLVNLEPGKLRNKPGNSLSYLVRLDELSKPQLYEESSVPTCHIVEPDGGPQGFAKIRISGPDSEQWAEFVGNQGFLRRDKVQERFVELLASSAGRSSLVGRPSDVDESLLCGSPGKVVDATQLHKILNSSGCNVFYGSGESNNKKFPDPRDFRIAIVEGCSCVRLRVGMIYSVDVGVETDVEVTLVLGIGFTAWPSTAQFPTRVNLSHPECLLYHEATCTGFFLVPAPPHPTLRCDDRPSTWQIRFPAAEQTLLKHYSPQSVPQRVLSTMRAIVYEIRSTNNGGHVISDYMLKTLLWYRLEEIPEMREWTHDRLAYHVVCLIDRLVSALRTQRHSSYFFPWFNMMLNSPGGGTLHYTEEDYNHDADLLSYQLRRLTDIAPCTVGDSDPWRRVETTMVQKWIQVLNELAPSPSTRGSRLSFHPLSSSGYSTIAVSQYSNRQLIYIGQLLRSMLNVRALTLAKSNSLPFFNGPECASSSEDLVYLISTIMEQAKMSFLGDVRQTSGTIFGSGGRAHAKEKIRTISDSYGEAASQLLEDVRSVKNEVDINDDNLVVREVLKWLYYGMDKDRKHLAPILRPYLSKLFTVSHGHCWFIAEWQQRLQADELESLGKFCDLICAKRIDLNDGVIDSFHKGWSWAEAIIKTSGELADGVELIFTPGPGKLVRFKMQDCKVDLDKIKVHTISRSLGRRKPICEEKQAGWATLPRHVKPFKEELKSKLHRHRQDDDLLTTSHNILKTASPMTQAIESTHRYGNNRGIGSIVQALITLRKFSVLQEVCSVLPEKDRAQILDEIQRVSKEVRRPRRPINRTLSSRAKPPQIYRSNNELSMAQDDDDEEDNDSCTADTLMGTCRQLRSRTSHPSVFNPAFFNAPSSEMISPIFLEPPQRVSSLTMENEMMHLVRSTRRKGHRTTNEKTTNL